MTRATDKYHGILRLNKPPGITSHDAVDEIRRITAQRSVGHTGTLDPAAEGLLVLCLGRATKIARFLTASDKTYEAEIRLGLESTTFDSEGVDKDATPAEVPTLSKSDLNLILREFVGRIRQTVPLYSAVHVDGQRLHRMARKGQEVTPPEREIMIRRIDLLSFDNDRLRITVECGKGTYIRSLAHDIGRRLGCGAYLSALRRMTSGTFKLHDALTLNETERLHNEGALESHMLAISQVLDLGAVTLSDEFSTHVKHGQVPSSADVISVEGEFSPGDSIMVRNRQGSVLALARASVSAQMLLQQASAKIYEYDRVLN